MSLSDIDKTHVWHPYSSMPSVLENPLVSSACGAVLTMEDGSELIDGMSSWWCAVHGYQVPELDAAVKKQLSSMAHVMFGGLTHEPALTLVENLLSVVPSGLEKVFLADSGSVSVEVALKMAIQYHMARGSVDKSQVMTLRGGYHGDTLGAMSVCDPVTGMHSLFEGVLPRQIFLPRPAVPFGQACAESDLAYLDRAFEQHHQHTAAFILEPVVQGAGGMWFYSLAYLKRIHELCKHYDVLLIADEIATGFGRTGRLFACEHADISPDILCLGKALTGGYMTLAATLCTEQVASTISAADPGVFMHGPTFMGNPLACAVASASITRLLNHNWREKVQAIQTGLLQGLAECRTMTGVSDVRVLGAIGVVELEHPVDMAKVQPAFIEQGVWVRPFGKLVYLMPPFIVDDEQLDHLCRAVCTVVAGLARDAL